ncbi:MAG: hypothetical protein BWY19_00298 [bacterium ADurb.Bin212]|nr:MAG: hypothetical protein BWY19_00298 [bacterium ADurb.Bin212]
MKTLSPTLKRHFENRQNEIDAEKYRESRKLDLYDEKSFYKSFSRDLLLAEKEVIIYSPFISKYRSEYFSRIFKQLKYRNIAVFIFTRSIEDHELIVRSEIKAALKDYEELGACIIPLPGLVHAKTAVIDRKILWDGSLNILSQRESREMMRRSEDEDMAKQVMDHLGLNKKLAEGYKYQYERLYRSLVDRKKFSFRPRLKIMIPKISVPKFISKLPAVISNLIVLSLKCMRAIFTLFS